jgi:hypothetical protein
VHGFGFAELQNYAVGGCGILVQNTNDARRKDEEKQTSTITGVSPLVHAP